MSLSETKRLIYGYFAYVEQLGCNWQIKSIVVFPVAIMCARFGILEEIIYSYLALAAADLLSGSFKAVVDGTWRVRRLYHFLLKIVCHMTVIYIVATCIRSVVLASGGNGEILMAGVVSALFVLCMTTEAQSIIRNMTLLGLPVPWWAEAVIRGVRMKSTVVITQTLGGSEKEFDKAAEAQHDRRA